MVEISQSPSTGGAKELPQQPSAATTTKSKGTEGIAASKGEALDTIAASKEKKRPIPPPSNPQLPSNEITLMSYLNSVETAKDNLTEKVYEATLSSLELSKKLRAALSTVITTLIEETPLRDWILENYGDVYDGLGEVFSDLKNGMEAFNEKARTTEIDGKTLQEATEEINQNIEDYNNGLISEEELQADIAAYNAYLAAWNQEMQGALNSVNSVIGKYNEFAKIYNDNLPLINKELQKQGFDQTAPPLPTIASVSPLPLLSLEVTAPPMAEVTMPEPLSVPDPFSNVSLPNAPPPALEDWLDSVLFPPATDSPTIANSLNNAYANNKMSLKDALYLASTLKKLNRMLPVELTTGESVGTATAMANRMRYDETLGQMVIKELTAAELTKTILEKYGITSDEAFLNQMARTILKVLADKGLSAATAAFQLLANEKNFLNMQSHTLRLLNALYGALGLKDAVAMKQLMQSMQQLVDSLEAAKELSAKEREQLAAELAASGNLTLLNASTQQMGDTLAANALSEQILAQGVEEAGLDYDRSSADFNQELYNQRAQESAAMENAQRETLYNSPYESRDDYASNQAYNYHNNGVDNATLSRELAIDDLNSQQSTNPLSSSARQREAVSRDAAIQSAVNDTLVRNRIADEATAAAISAAGIVDENLLASRLADLLIASGVARGDAMKAGAWAASSALANEAALRSSAAFRDMVAALLAAGKVASAVEASALARNLEFDGIIDMAALEQAAKRGKMNEQQIDALKKLLPLTPSALAEEAARQLTGTTGLNYQMAIGAAASLKANDFIRVGDMVQQMSGELEARGLSSALAEPIVDKALNIGDAFISEAKFTEVIRDLLTSSGAVDPKAAQEISKAVGLEAFIERGRLEGQVQAALAAQGLSSGEAKAVAARASTELFKSETSPAEFSGLEAAAAAVRRWEDKQPEFLRTSLEGFFTEKGVPKELSRKVADEVAEAFYFEIDKVSDQESYYALLKELLHEVRADETHDLDLSHFIEQEDIDAIEGELAISPHLRVEVLQQSLVNGIADSGIDMAAARRSARFATETLLADRDIFNKKGDALEEAIASALVKEGVVDREEAREIAKNANTELLINGPPLDSSEGAKLLSESELQPLILERLRDQLSPALSNKAKREVESALSEFLTGQPTVGAPKENGSPRLAELYKEQLQTLAAGENSAVMEAIKRHSHHFQTPSFDAYWLLREFTEAGVTLTASLLTEMEKAQEQQNLNAHFWRTV